MSKNNEIIIFSVCKDTSTSEVSDWVYHYGGFVSRINSIKDVVHFLNDNHDIQLADPIHRRDDISVWFRRTPEYESTRHLTNNKETDDDIQKFYYLEQRALLVGFYNTLKNAKWLNSWSNVSPAKIVQLHVALSVGLLTPKTFITYSRDTLSR